MFSTCVAFRSTSTEVFSSKRLRYFSGTIGKPLRRARFSKYMVTIGVRIEETKTLVATMAVAEAAVPAKSPLVEAIA